MKPGEVLIFQNECSDDPNYDEAGDVHFVLQEAAGDDGWVRKGDDLETSITITFVESLLGCSKQLKGHPGYPHGLTLTIPPVSLNSEVLKLTEKGMARKDGTLGVLFCKLQVIVGTQDRERVVRNQPLIEAIFNTGSKDQEQKTQDS
jgi:DnaJ-class molecular chaperone